MFSIPSFLLSSFCCSFYSQIVSCLLPSSSYFHCSPVLFYHFSVFFSSFLLVFLYSVSRVSAPPFLVRSRPQAVRITSRAQTLSFQGEALLSQLQVIGGNKTGVFVHKVTDGSAAHSIGISPGAQILEVCVCFSCFSGLHMRQYHFVPRVFMHLCCYCHVSSSVQYCDYARFTPHGIDYLTLLCVCAGEVPEGAASSPDASGRFHHGGGSVGAWAGQRTLQPLTAN